MTTPRRPATSNVPVPLAIGVGAVALVLAGLATAAFSPYAVADPGAAVRWGLPLTEVVRDVSMSAALGLLGLAVFVLPERSSTDRRGQARRLAAVAAGLWATAGALAVLFTFGDLSGTPLSSSTYWSQVSTFVLTLEFTRVLVINAAVGLVVALGAAVARSRAATAWLLTLGLVGLVVLALTGHAAGSADHEAAVNSLGVHLLGVGIWVGGLIGLVALRPVLGVDLGASVARYSTVALWCFVAVALSGIQQSWLRLGSLAGLDTAYGALIVVKALALIALGVLGWRQRGRLARRLGANPFDGKAFARLALTEVALMGLAIGVAVALGRSAPPAPDAAANPSRITELTGYPDPGPMHPSDWVLAWRPNWLLLAIAVLAIGLYAAGARRLQRRGDRWPVGRTVCWTLGWVVFVWATSGGPDIWGRLMFSVHMVMHMTIAMVVPLLLVPGAPITLALRALPARQDLTWGPRELLLQVVHSRALRAVATPVVAAVLFFVSLAMFYFSPAFQLALTTHTGHLLMLAHFLLTGYLFTWVLIGIDPGPKKWSPLLLLVILFATVSFHAFFGVILTGSQTLLAPGFFQALQLPWLTDPIKDQVTAGEIAWGVGELPTLILALLVARAWMRSDGAEAVRRDRQADRDGDAELTAYNEMLAQRRASFQHGDRREDS